MANVLFATECTYKISGQKLSIPSPPNCDNLTRCDFEDRPLTLGPTAAGKRDMCEGGQDTSANR